MARLLRLGLPIGFCVIAVVLVVATNFSDTGVEYGCALFAVASSVGLLNWFYNLGVTGDLERDSEQAARDFFAEHGRWPTRADRVGEHTPPASHHS